MQKIASAQNGTFKKLASLTGAKGLKKEKLFLLSGEKLIREFLAQPHLKIVGEVTAPAMKPLLAEPDAGSIQLTRELFADIDVLGTNFNILVLEQPPLPVLKAEDLGSYAPRGIEVATPIGDPGNLGALLRSCEAFAVPRVILTQEAAHPFLPKTVKASAGSVLRLKLVRGPRLQDFPASCIALDMDGTMLDGFKWPKNGMLIMGEEGIGFGAANHSVRRFKQRVRIPTEGVQSLNVVVAASIALAHRMFGKK